MKSSLSRALINMNPELSDTGSIAGIFVDVDGIRRGMNRPAVFRTIKGDNLSDKAALGKSRRLMSSCIKGRQQDGTLNTYHIHQHNSHSPLTP